MERTPFNDDEEIAPANTWGAMPKGRTGPIRQVQLAKYYNPVAPLAHNDQEVLLELKGISSSDARAALDLVVVIDVSSSMGGEKLKKIKDSLLFVMHKLTNVDRLCIVTFSDHAKRLCPLRFVTDASHADFKALVDGLEIGNYTNVKDGLETAISIVNGRRLTAGRAVSIMLMSDGCQNVDGDAMAIEHKGMPVHTFGFGADHDATLLGAIANKSLGGTFNYVADNASITETFSQVLGGLLTIIAQDLELTVTRSRGESNINLVDAGTYPQTNVGGSSVTIRFGTLYSGEVRRVIVYLVLGDKSALPPYKANVAKVQYRFTSQEQKVTSNAVSVIIHRTRRVPDSARKPKELQTELARRQHADIIRVARDMAEAKDIQNARKKLEEGQKVLDDNLDPENPMMDMLQEELPSLQKLMERQDLYAKEGRPRVVSLLSFHDRQRGGQIFMTRIMRAHLEQAKRFDKNPNAPLPPVTEDDDVPVERRTLSAALRAVTAILSLAALAVMASVRSFDYYDRYKQYRYAVGANVIVCIYSSMQAVVEIRRLVSQSFISRSTSINYCFNFLLDQVLAYLLMSASSTAASQNDMWVSRLGKDPFNAKINSAVWLSFLGFFALAASALISMENFFRHLA